MRLVELEPQFKRYEERRDGDPSIKPAGGEFGDPRDYTAIIKVDTLAEAQGIWFLCPACYVKNGGPVGTHMVQVGFEGRGLLPHQASQSRNGGPSRWGVSGSSYADLTLSPSIDCSCWHGHVKNGEITP